MESYNFPSKKKNSEKKNLLEIENWNLKALFGNTIFGFVLGFPKTHVSYVLGPFNVETHVNLSKL